MTTFINPSGTERKIDFFAGAHGNFLELVVNHSIDQNPYDISKPQFTDTGACHLKHHGEYVPITIASDWSNLKHQFTDNDYVTRIMPTQSDMLILITNSFLRSGNEHLDINHLEVDTFSKMSKLPKLSEFLKTLVQNHGESKSYARNILRHYFESMFAVPEHGIDTMINWMPAKNSHQFDFSSFFQLDRFIKSLQDIAKFTNMEFQLTPQLIDLYDQFLEKNQGWQSHLKCNKIVESLIRKIPVTLDLNIIEEAWISYRISEIFNLYDLSCCRQDNFPATTAEIIKEIELNLPRAHN